MTQQALPNANLSTVLKRIHPRLGGSLPEFRTAVGASRRGSARVALRRGHGGLAVGWGRNGLPCHWGWAWATRCWWAWPVLARGWAGRRKRSQRSGPGRQKQRRENERKGFSFLKKGLGILNFSKLCQIHLKPFVNIFNNVLLEYNVVFIK